MVDYQSVFERALALFIDDYTAGHLALKTRTDLLAAVYYCCLAALDEQGAERPYAIHCNIPLADSRDHFSLVLGENEVAIELRLEPDYPELPSEQRPLVFTDDLEYDFERMRRLTANSLNSGYSILLDEDGRHLRFMPHVTWQHIEGARKAYLLVRRFKNGEVM